MDTFLQLALKRRSIRKYTAQPVEQEKIEQMLQAALASPSSKHQNPWEMVVVTDRDQLTKMASCKTYGSQMLKEAPLGIVVLADKTATDTWQCDASILAFSLLLSATDLGLGACWVHIHDRSFTLPDGTEQSAETAVRQMLGIPEQKAVLCIVAVGYPNEEKKPINPEKLQYEKVHYGKY
ncbi:MAG: nitroreductase family protein [Paludibacteraceae bacterium]|nr:nitroreductase family protein [Paludibacteraceae bacterium]